MLKVVCSAALLLSSSAALAYENAEDYLARGRDAAIKSCLSQFADHPFDPADVNAKFLAPTVSVFNHGTTLEDSEVTTEPVLVVIAPAINVLGDVTYKLQNPNAWYCLASNISVLGTTKVELACDAHFAQSNVTVGSKATVERVGCP